MNSANVLYVDNYRLLTEELYPITARISLITILIRIGAYVKYIIVIWAGC